jgi:outer membrane protein
MLKSVLALSLLVPTTALAQAVSSSGDLLADAKDDRWSVGVAVGARDSPYVGEGTRIRPLPLVTYDGERFFWRGVSGGIHLVQGSAFSLDAVLAGRFDGFDINDLSRAGLARNGLDASTLEDRDDALDAGLAASWRGQAGELKVSALADVTDTSGGYELAVDYAYALQWGRTTIVPGAGVRWMSSDLVNYYYGTLDEEIRRGAPRYQPGSAVVPQVSVGFSRPLGDKWRVLGGVDYKFLPSELTDSPLLEPGSNGSAGVRLGISRSF